jgi:hypothetical protein
MAPRLSTTTVATYAVLTLAGAVSFLAPDRLTASRSRACADGAAIEAGAAEVESAGASQAPEPRAGEGADHGWTHGPQFDSTWSRSVKSIAQF